MQRFFLKPVLTLVLALAGTAAFAGEGIEFFHGKWDDAVKKAKASDKLIFMDVYADWCGPCKYMSKKVFTEDAVGEYYNEKFISFKLEGDAEENLDFAGKLQIEAYPTLIFFDSEGKEISRQAGALGGDDFIALGKKAVSVAEVLPQIKAEYEKDPDNIKSTQAYLNALADAGRQEEGATIALPYLDELKNEDLKKDENWAIAKAFLKDVHSKKIDYLFKESEYFYAEDPEGFTQLMSNAISEGVAQAIENKDKSGLKRVKSVFKKLAQSTESVNADEKELDYYIDMSYYRGVDDRKSYFKSYQEWVEKFKMEDSEALTEAILQLCQESDDKSELAVAEKWAKGAIKKDDNAMNNFVYCAVLLSQKEYGLLQEQLKVTEGKDQDGQLSLYIAQMREAAANAD